MWVPLLAIAQRKKRVDKKVICDLLKKTQAVGRVALAPPGPSLMDTPTDAPGGSQFLLLFRLLKPVWKCSVTLPAKARKSRKVASAWRSTAVPADTPAVPGTGQAPVRCLCLCLQPSSESKAAPV
ncbi:hypothetical protein PCASD_24913 [Puccinia coronata f. sp. avenae]|uniref:Uncharacterized protein n=1 Tax=Puccinia coronata f. sp. avenae TaxID=200324 RepID=A0A2N5SH34_9BASI|nr:hypothetical protein PCASD_24913 [Puccinia coronata f. sp. avenae]